MTNEESQRRRPPADWRRHALGVVAAVLFVTGVCFWIWPPASAGWEFLHGVCIKSGTVLAILWLAYPQVRQLPASVLGGVLVAAAILAVRPQLVPALARGLIVIAPILIPVLVLLWLLRAPRKRNRRP